MPIAERLRKHTPDEWDLHDWKALMNIIMDLLYCSTLEQAIDLTQLHPVEMTTAIEMFAMSSLFFDSETDFAIDMGTVNDKRYEITNAVKGLEFYASAIRDQMCKAEPDDPKFH